MPIATQFSLKLENRPGALATTCSELAAKAVNIQAIVAEAWQPGRVRLVVNNTETARKVFEAKGIDFSEEKVLVVRLSDRPGALGRITRKLAENQINIDYAYGSIEKGAPKALVILGVSELEKAAALVK
ncbi:ACT domain-containing protein [Acidobacteriia bacterium AH_259_A11_L15]|nr:ACT domain-containing protein [Acidobacteriia bacterium AH_259_A11_L15]